MFPSIVADIGGTNARFALAMQKTTNMFEFSHVRIAKTSDYPSFEAVLAAYIDQLEGIRPKAACIAIACPVDNDHIKMTNVSWRFSTSAIQSSFEFETFEVINDFAANALATSRLSSGDLMQIKEGVTDELANKVILGPGTGFGVAGLIHTGSHWLPISCAAGHVNLPASTPFEIEVLAVLNKEHGHVAAETCLSGPGLVNLYRAVASVTNLTTNDLTPVDITARALNGSDETCHLTLNTFCSFLGSVSGNLALTYGAKGGVYIVSDMLANFKDFFIASDFNKRFNEKGVMSHYVERIPVNIITCDELAFLGAAAWLEKHR